MEIKIKNSNPVKEKYRIVTWAANTTGNQRNDEICELASFSASDVDSSFSKYVMPYCNVKQKFWEQHGLIEVNSRRFRVLLDSDNDKVLNTKTELYALRDYLNWLEGIKGQYAGIILVCYEPNDYISQILLESLHRCRLNEHFSKIVKTYINCFDICKDRYGKEVKYCSLSDVSSMLFNDNTDFKRALARAKGCHKILAHIRDDVHNFEELIELYIKTIASIEQLVNQDQQSEKIVKKRKQRNSKNVSFQINNEGGANIFETNEVNSANKLDNNEEKPKDTLHTNYLNCKIIGWANNTIGRRYEDENLHIAAFSPNLMFSQYIMPKKRIYSCRYRSKIRIIKENGVKQLKDLQTGKVLETKSEKLILEDFIHWLQQIKDNDSEGIIILYHEDKKCSLLILLESLRRYKLIEAFSNVVKGFVNTYNVLQDKCAHLTNLFTLKNMTKLLLKKQIEIGNAMIRAKVCYEIIENLAQIEAGELPEKNTHICNLIQPYVRTVLDEEKVLAQLKINLNEQRKLNSKKKANQPKPTEKNNANEKTK